MGMKIRPATLDDVPAVARLVLAALADEPPWRAFVPPKAQARADLVEHAEAALRRFVRPANSDGGVCFLVLELSGADVGCRAGPPLVVAAVAWDAPAVDDGGDDAPSRRRPSTMSGVEDDSTGTLQPSLTPSARTATHLIATTAPNSASHDDESEAPGKVAALVGAMSKGKEQRFLGHDPCLYLRLLATRPDHQRRGYGKVLAAKAIEFARQQHLSVCLQSGARGYILFSGLGFSDMGPVMLPAEAKGGEELMLKAMMLSKERVQRRASWMESLLRYVAR
ncbi:GNAT family acetyltransferase [Purpureocillium lavendulum]|uniref:GNAT family acetyltransferase n=1 Tax=Purpureocillium lavendulum TaxID=1247861 RepID=A0AB34FSE9_9HYPO|nr:GNAT family acetyltransferase [Purpureocillium lavendulum]